MKNVVGREREVHRLAWDRRSSTREVRRWIPPKPQAKECPIVNENNLGNPLLVSADLSHSFIHIYIYIYHASFALVLTCSERSCCKQSETHHFGKFTIKKSIGRHQTGFSFPLSGGLHLVWRVRGFFPFTPESKPTQPQVT